MLSPIGWGQRIWCGLADSVIRKAMVILSLRLAIISGLNGTTAVW